MSLYRFDEVKQAFADVNDLLAHLKQFQNKYNGDFADALETFCVPVQLGYLYHLKLDQHIEECVESCDKILKCENRFEKQKKYLYHPSFKTTIQHLCKDNLFVIFRFCDDHDLSCLQNVSLQWRVLSLSSPWYKWQAPSSLPSNFKTITLSQYQYLSIMQYSDYIKHFDTDCIKNWKDLSLHRMDKMVMALKNIQTLYITISEHLDNETANHLLYLFSIHCPLLHLIQLGAHYRLKQVKQKFIIHSHNSLQTISTHRDDHFFDTIIEIIHSDSLRSVHKLPDGVILYSRINTFAAFQNLGFLSIMFLDIDVTLDHHSLFPTLKHLTLKRNNRRISNHLKRSEIPSLSISQFGFHSSFLNVFALHLPVLQSIQVEFLEIPDWRNDRLIFRDPALREEPYMEVIQNPQVQFDLQFLKIQLLSLLRECSKTLCDITLNQLWMPLFWTASTFDVEERQIAQRDFSIWQRQVSELFPFPSSHCATLCTIDPLVVKNVHIYTTDLVPFMWSVDDSKASHTIQVSIKNRMDKSFRYYREDRWLSQLSFGIPLPVQTRVSLDHYTVSVGMDHVSELNVCSTDFFIHQCKVTCESELENSWFYDPSYFSAKFDQLRQLSLQFPHMGMIYLFQRPQYFLHLQHLPFLQSVKLDIEFQDSNVMRQKPDLAFIPTLSLHAKSLPALESIDTLGFHVAWVDGGEVSLSLKTLVVMHGCCWTHMDDKNDRELCLDVSSEVSLDMISQDILKVISESQIQSQCLNIQLSLIDLPHLELVHLCYLRNREFKCETLVNQCCIQKCPRLSHVVLETSTLISTPLKLEHSVDVSSLPSLLILEESLFGDHTSFHFADNPALQVILCQSFKTPDTPDPTCCILQWMQQKIEGLFRFCYVKNLSQKHRQILLDGSEYIESVELVLQSLGLEKDEGKGFHYKDKEGMIVKQRHAIHPSLMSLLVTSVRCGSFLSYFEDSKFHIPPPNYIVSKNTCLYFNGVTYSSQKHDTEDYEFD